MKSRYTIKQSLLFAVAFLFIGLASCTDDPAGIDDEGPGEEELITRVSLTLAGDNGTATAQWNDSDGPGGADPVIDTLRLQPSMAYTGTIELFNTTVSPAENITAEIREENDEHQFFYSFSGPASQGGTVEITDTDGNGLPVGLQYTFTVGSVSAGTNGTFNIVLSHYDDFPKDGSTRSDETDIDITIPVEIVAN